MTKLNSIGIAKEIKDTLVVVAMSGGVEFFNRSSNDEERGI